VTPDEVSRVPTGYKMSAASNSDSSYRLVIDGGYIFGLFEIAEGSIILAPGSWGKSA
jgi:hypothetical protein